MKFYKTGIVMFTMFLFVVAGCVKGITNEEQKIVVQKRVGEENKYGEFKEVTDNVIVQKVKKIVEDVVWENAKVSMVRPADYRFAFQYKNPEIEAKGILYELWISPNKDKVELVINGESKYAQLNEKDSAVLLGILTGGM
ncbi:hypothetical protein IMZ08_18040 [Bacillus luteolus]|uniref:YhfM-like domain-containing protein n=1 Tax=Litchfieldia luteola TaxID=682179 RepID=A0ABR9QN59_9BACI|nr:hypothetical protein [Cytobacillus luteolus]MBE4909940.1 hypothetical protein [Cytobacillus luteolus]MBP1942504.1 hypothetical protein [Cytobacillus luteolus]